MLWCCGLCAGVMTAGAAPHHQPVLTAQSAHPLAGPHLHQPAAAHHAAQGAAAQALDPLDLQYAATGSAIALRGC
jgi:hypothetical protein